MAEVKVSRRPWFVGAQNDALYVIDGPPAANNDFPHHEYGPEPIAKVYDQEHAEFIVRAVNAHDDLLAACKEFVRKCECGEASSRRSYAQMKAAIDKAEGR